MSRPLTDCSVILKHAQWKKNGTSGVSDVFMIPSASRYCAMNYLMSLEDQTCWVIFIVKVSRMPSQSQYIGFQGGEY